MLFTESLLCIKGRRTFTYSCNACNMLFSAGERGTLFFSPLHGSQQGLSEYPVFSWFSMIILIPIILNLRVCFRTFAFRLYPVLQSRVNLSNQRGISRTKGILIPFQPWIRNAPSHNKIKRWNFLLRGFCSSLTSANLLVTPALPLYYTHHSFLKKSAKTHIKMQIIFCAIFQFTRLLSISEMILRTHSQTRLK